MKLTTESGCVVSTINVTGCVGLTHLWVWQAVSFLRQRGKDSEHTRNHA